MIETNNVVERRYPLWLNVASAIALLTLGIGLIAFFFDQLTGVGMEAVGWLGIWVTGTLAERASLTQGGKANG